MYPEARSNNTDFERHLSLYNVRGIEKRLYRTFGPRSTEFTGTDSLGYHWEPETKQRGTEKVERLQLGSYQGISQTLSDVHHA